MKKLSTQQGNQGGQDCHANWYCPTCHSSIQAHEKGCIDKKVQISATARIPRKNASKKVWDEFYKKFVLEQDVKYIQEQKKKRDADNPKLQYEKFERLQDSEKHEKEFRIRFGLTSKK